MLKIRPAFLNDAKILLLVHRDAVFSKAAGYYDQARLEAWSPGASPEKIACMEQEIVDPNYIVLVGENENEIIGFAMAIPSKNQLRRLYVKTNTIGNVGCALLAAIEKQAFAAGAKFLELVAGINAETFYKNNGYMVIGREDHVTSNGEVSAALQMKKIFLNAIQN